MVLTRELRIACAVLCCHGCHAVLPLDRAPDGLAGGDTLDQQGDAPRDGAGICPVFVPDFAITSAAHAETEDLESVVTRECGQTYRVGDWDDITPHAKSIKAWAECVGLRLHDMLWVTRGGAEYWTTSRHYFIQRHDHEKPVEFLDHDSIDDNLVSLGSWYGLSMPVLCKLK